MNFDKIIPVLEILNKFAGRSTEIRDIHELALEVEHILEEVIGMEYNGLFLYDFVDKKLKLYYAKGFSEEERAEAERTVMDRHPGYVFKTGKMLYVPDIEANNPPMSIDSKRSFRIRTRLSIPVFNGETVVGVFSIASPEANKFTQEQIAVFSFIGNLAGSIYGHILNRSELQKLALIARHTDNAILITDKEGRADLVNEAFEKTTGYKIDEIRGKKILEMVQGSDRKKIKPSKIIRAMMEKRSVEMNVEFFTKEGKPYWAWLQVQPVFNGQGEITQFISIHRDISQRKKIEDALKDNVKQTRLIIDTALDAYILINSKSIVIRWNKQAEKMFGYSIKEAVGKKISDLIIPDSMRELHVLGMKNFLQHGTGAYINKRIEITAQHKSGEQFLVELAVNPLRIRNDNFFSAFIKDISVQKKSQYELESSTSRISTLMQNLHAGILVENEYRKIVLVNKGFCHLFDIPAEPEQLVGIDCASALDQAKHLFKEPDKFIERINDLLSARQQLIEEQLELADGRVFERDYLPIFSGDRFLGNLWQYSDITLRKKAETELKNARQEAISASIAKSQFLANMSHEIRTPLHAIHGLTRLLEDTQITEEQKRLIKGLNSSSEGLLSIVNDVLDFTKIEAGQMDLFETEFLLDELVKNVFDAFEFKADEKEVKLQIKFDKKIKGHLWGDSVRLRQVLINLMNNAIKFTPKGQVILECKLVKSTRSSFVICFNVADTGIGIAEENRLKIFQSFQQEDSGTTRSYGGTGLGLAISKQLVELMGGQLDVTSIKNHGSEFFFTLSFRKVKVPVKPTVENLPELNVSFLEGIRILLVEDNRLNQFIAKSMLQKWNMIVTVANNGREALEILRENSFQIVLMDLQMPEMGGIEATRIMRSELNLDVPVIALTANAIKGVIEECLSAGMNDYILKPFVPDVLSKKIFQLLARKD